MNMSGIPSVARSARCFWGGRYFGLRFVGHRLCLHSLLVLSRPNVANEDLARLRDNILDLSCWVLLASHSQSPVFTIPRAPS